jgi:hypothetical protein
VECVTQQSDALLFRAWTRLIIISCQSCKVLSPKQHLLLMLSLCLGMRATPICCSYSIRPTTSCSAAGPYTLRQCYAQRHRLTTALPPPYFSCIVYRNLRCTVARVILDCGLISLFTQPRHTRGLQHPHPAITRVIRFRDKNVTPHSHHLCFQNRWNAISSSFHISKLISLVATTSSFLCHPYHPNKILNTIKM